MKHLARVYRMLLARLLKRWPQTSTCAARLAECRPAPFSEPERPLLVLLRSTEALALLDLLLARLEVNLQALTREELRPGQTRDSLAAVSRELLFLHRYLGDLRKRALGGEEPL